MVLRRYQFPDQQSSIKSFAAPMRCYSSSQDPSVLDETETDPLAIDLDSIESTSVDPNEDVDALQPVLDEANIEDCQIKQLVQCNSMSQVEYNYNIFMLYLN